MATVDHSEVPVPSTRRVTLPTTANEVREVLLPPGAKLVVGSPLSDIKFAVGVSGLADGDAAIGSEYRTVVTAGQHEVPYHRGSLYLSSPTISAVVELVYG